LLERDCTRFCQGSTANICRGGVHADAGERENVAQKYRVHINRRGTGDVPKQASTRTGIDHINDRIGRSDQCARHLEYPSRVGITPAIKGERSRQIGHSSCNRIDAWCKREPC